MLVSSLQFGQDGEASKHPLLLADDWAWPNAGVYGDKVVRTPTFDRVAREGMCSTIG